MITTVTSVQRFATKTLYTRARATDGSTMLAPMSPGAGKALRARRCVSRLTNLKCEGRKMCRLNLILKCAATAEAAATGKQKVNETENT